MANKTTTDNTIPDNKPDALEVTVKVISEINALVMCDHPALDSAKQEAYKLLAKLSRAKSRMDYAIRKASN